MHQAKKIIKLKDKSKLRYFSYSIPIMCVMLLLSLLILPSRNKVYAEPTTSCKPSGKDDPTGYTQDKNTCAWIPNLTPSETFEVTNTTSTTPTASLKIDNSTSTITDKVNSSYGVTNYASHTVSVSVTEAGSYSLILSGPAQLDGPSTINATSGATGANLANDTWGYAWESTNVVNANANYKPLSTNVTLTGNPALSNKTVNFSKKLAFAAKFSDKSDAGIYHADVSLSLVAAPEYTTTTITVNATPWDKLVYMQDMSEASCKQAKIGDSKTLIDIRDNNAYTIAKLSDNRCWMTQNLRLSRETLKSGLVNKITQYDTNIDSSYTVPASTTGTFNNTKDASDTYYINQQIRASSNDTYGAYYSYNVATLNKAWDQSSGTAAYDICPKGWRLPTGGSNGEFALLRNKSGTTAVGVFAANSTTSGWWVGGGENAPNATFFPAAGFVNTDSLNNTGSGGYYWSSTIRGATLAHSLDFNSNNIYPVGDDVRCFGFSIRCVAK